MRPPRRTVNAPDYLRSSKELQIHCAVADLLRFTGRRGLIYFHPANGEVRSPRTGAKLKRMGVRAGVADFALTLPDGRSAYLEIKSDEGVQSLEQQAFALQCEEYGVPYQIARSLKEAETILWGWNALRRRAA